MLIDSKYNNNQHQKLPPIIRFLLIWTYRFSMQRYKIKEILQIIT